MTNHIISSDDLLKAILAMDAYNQGYDKVIDHGETQIGNATLGIQDVSAEAFSAGFYAVSYSTNFGTVISYRGTDKWGNNPFTNTSGSDVPAFALGGGVWNVAQARLAAEFYQAVNGDSIASSSTITLVGHSLGGGLAGFIGAIYQQDAVLFDNMPFEAAAQDAYDIASDSNVIFANENKLFQLVA